MQSPKPMLRFIKFTLLYLLLLIGIPELLLRHPRITHSLGVGSVGSLNVELDVKALDIEKYARETGAVNCLIIGASDTDAAFKPQRITRHHCYNFGVGGIGSRDAILILDVLLNKYDIDLLIVGASSQFMIEAPRFTEVIEKSAWLCCYNGRFNVAGWLGHYSAAYQYGELGMVWLRDPILYSQLRTYASSLEAGFSPREGSILATDAEFRLMVDDFEKRNPRILEAAQNGRMPNRDFIAYLAQLEDQGVQVVAVRPLIRPDAVDDFPEYQAVAEVFATYVVPEFKAHGITYLEPADDLNLPISYWRDFIHMNRDGANAFSDWLDGKLSEIEGR